MPDLPVLEPVPASWKVSPAVPYLVVSAAESASTATTVELFATHQDGTESRVRLTFRHGHWMRWSPSHSDGEVVREADYDWSEVPRLTVADYECSRQRIREMWERTGRCPDPRMYEVRDSPWLEELDRPSVTGENYRHFLVLGHDVYVEVLATGWHEDELTERKM